MTALYRYRFLIAIFNFPVMIQKHLQEKQQDSTFEVHGPAFSFFFHSPAVLKTRLSPLRILCIPFNTCELSRRSVLRTARMRFEKKLFKMNLQVLGCRSFGALCAKSEVLTTMQACEVKDSVP
jgi:hypothetical protein